MKNELLDKGIILPSGEIGKDKINLVAGAITQPFAEMVWVTTGGDMETIDEACIAVCNENIRALAYDLQVLISVYDTNADDELTAEIYNICKSLLPAAGYETCRSALFSYTENELEYR